MSDIIEYKLPSLSTLLSLRFPDVLKRYKKDYPNNRLTDEVAFAELMKFFWISVKLLSEKKYNKKLNFDILIIPEIAEIDDMWHTFILFTRLYERFSIQYFGQFLHHNPPTSLVFSKRIENPYEYVMQIAKGLHYVYFHLGESTLRSWFSERYFSGLSESDSYVVIIEHILDTAFQIRLSLGQDERDRMLTESMKQSIEKTQFNEELTKYVSEYEALKK